MVSSSPRHHGGVLPGAAQAQDLQARTLAAGVPLGKLALEELKALQLLRRQLPEHGVALGRLGVEGGGGVAPDQLGPGREHERRDESSAKGIGRAGEEGGGEGGPAASPTPISREAVPAWPAGIAKPSEVTTAAARRAVVAAGSAKPERPARRRGAPSRR
jgi:hypothetical protein